MTQTDPLILLTRPVGAARRFATQVAGLGLGCVIAPLMRIVPVSHDSGRLHAAKRLVLTSVHAVPAAGPGAGRLAFCVGPATADAARKAGFDVIEGPGDAARLGPMLAGQGELLHPHGRHVTVGLPVDGMVVYDQIAQPLPDAGQRALAGAARVLWPLFSPRSARLAAQAVKMHGGAAPVVPLAISRAAADAFGASGRGMPIAATPDADGMIGAIEGVLTRLRVVASDCER